jgi:hypothetical protein
MITKKISLNELRTLVKQVIKEEESNRISVFDYVDDNSNDGYATALYDKNHELIDDYVDPNDYPDMYVSERGAILTGKYKGGSLGIHSGGIKDLDYIEKYPTFESSDNTKQQYKKGDKLTIDMGNVPEEVTILSNIKAGLGRYDFISLGRSKGAPYTLSLGKLEKVLVK